MHIQEMITTHPVVHGKVNMTLVRCIEECVDCAQSCNICADACLGEPEVGNLVQCIRLNLDCADACTATGKLASRRSGSNEELLRTMLETCAQACRLCGEECARHASMHELCRICAESCERCERACWEAARTSGTAG